MRHAVFVEPGKLEWRETPEPVLQGSGEALVRPLVVGRCDLDVAFVRGLMPMPGGSPIGHEIIGEVVALGDGVEEFSLGQRVFVPAQISCGACVNCRRGLTGRCNAVPFAASYGMGREGGFGGGLADLVRVPFAAAMLTAVPAGVDAVGLIGMADMAPDAWRAVAPHLHRHPEARVLVLGGMPPVIGLYAVGLAIALGAPVVDYVDADPRRAAVARDYGARVLEAPPLDEPYDLIVVANPTKAALEQAFRLAAPGATISSVSPAVDGAPELDTRSLYHRGITWSIGRPDCRHAHDGTLSAWANCGFCSDLVPTHQVAWDDAPEAWASDALYVAAVRS
ncbi:MAG: alcohol dehydrogenase catalytic domain-containing protein [Phenylobacterium sp.]|uniref:zinc-dependent alcohol dehydrogenase n=1 Tax=Phenylobacterium sp. TaxID=1871053 RepID=UPI0027373CE7|nr:alcohol dehydrogenase catalytic domain-containing protein [Phenylobacterium sp.]MDP3749612.1 alcohol dehydrogenase catalytic domain-containing protein [Phenylobacterium sp.]